MRQTKPMRMLAGLAAVFLALHLAGCGGTAPASSPAPGTAPASGPATEDGGHYPVTVTNYNYAGEPVTYTYQEAPRRVLAVYQGSIESMIALGLEDRVAAAYGLDNEVKEEWRAGFERMPYHDEAFAPDLETVTLLQPDMILSWGSLFSEKNLGDTGGWNAKGTATYMNTNTRPGGYPRTLENEYTDLLTPQLIRAVYHVDAVVSEIDGRPAIWYRPPQRKGANP